MKNKIASTIVAVLYSFAAFAQKNIEKTMFENICKHIITQNNYALIKKNIKGVSIVADPVSGSEDIVFDKKIDKKRIAEFNKYTKDEQFNILKSEVTPFFPLRDTVFIVDTLSFFSSEMIFAEGSHFFQVLRKARIPNSKVEFVSLFAAGVRENNLIVSLLYNKYLSNFYFELGTPNFQLYKFSTTKMEFSIE